MPHRPQLLLTLLLAMIAGCGNSMEDSSRPGPVDKDLLQDAIETNQQRLAGEDHPIHRSIVTSPFHAIAETYDKYVSTPIAHFWDYMTHDTPAIAARKMIDPNSPDNRRAGVLRLTDFAFARKGPSLTVYAHMANDEDYTVRAAGIRALNRCRAKGFTDVLLKGLNDDQPLVRVEAAKALANIPDADAVEPLISRMRTDVSRDVRIACADALRMFKTIEVAQALVGVLDDKDFSVSWQARQSLELMTGQDYRYDPKAWLAYLASTKIFG